MVDVYRERVRAEIDVGGLTFATPDVKSFHITRNRGSISANFSASLEVDPAVEMTPGLDVVIRAGTLGQLPLKQRFTGIIKSVTVNPSWEKADRIVINISGNDRMFILDERKFTRRYPWSGLGRWAAITGINRQRKADGSSYKTIKRKRSIDRGAWSTDGDLTGANGIISTPDVIDPLNFLKDPEDRRREEDQAGVSPSYTLDPGTIVALPYTGSSVDSDLWQVSLSDSDTPNIDTGEECGTYWTLSNTDIAAFGDPACSDDRKTANVRITGIGHTRLTFVDVDGRWGATDIMSMVPHTHETLAQGGPAFGTFSA